MNALAVELLAVAKEYLGPAAPAFLSREFHAIGVSANTVEATHVLPLAERAYRQLVAKHGDADSYAGLARTLVSRGDPDGAINALRDGASALARSGDRASAIALLGVA